MSSTLTDLTAATTWSGTDLFYALVGGNSRKIAAAKFLVAETSSSLSMQDSTTAQTFRVYRTFTDSSNYERLVLQTGSGYVELAAETAGTGTDNLNIRLTTTGSGGVIVNGTTNSYFFGETNKFTIHQIDAGQNMGLLRWQSNNTAPVINFAKSRGSSVDSFTVVQDGDELGNFLFWGADGTDFAWGAAIQAFVDGTPGNNDLPSRLVFKVSADGSATPTEALRISSTGQVTIQIGTVMPSGGSTALRLVMGSTAGFGIYIGTGPPTVSAAKGSLYLRDNGTGTSDRLYVNTNGSTTWTSVTTAA
jgi:hypothetical protein